MSRPLVALVMVLAMLAACAAPPPLRIGADGRPLPQVYQIRAADTNEIQFRMLDGVNSLRQAAGVPPVAAAIPCQAAASRNLATGDCRPSRPAAASLTLIQARPRAP